MGAGTLIRDQARGTLPIRATLPADIWDGYLKISAVRNPFDYAISRYFWEGRTAPLPPFGDWLRDNPELLLENRRITHIDGRCAADVMLRYEHFDSDLAALSDRLSLPENLFEILSGISAKTGNRPSDTTPSRMFSDFPDCRTLVEILCREDIETYGYRAP